MNTKAGNPPRKYLSLFLFCYLPLIAFLALFGSGGATHAIKDANSSEGNLSLSGRYGIVSSHLPLYPSHVKQAELDNAKAAGITWLRCVFAWSDMEPRQGQWSFTGADEAVEMALGRGINILGVLLASPPWANGGNPWNYPPQDMEAWYNYVYIVSQRYRGKVKAWEVWNEQNIEAFWMPRPDPAQYVRLLSVASRAVRDADPGAKVIMGGVAGLDPDFLNRCLASGAHQYVDGIAYHPYPETLQAGNYRPQEEHCRNIVSFLRWLISLYTSRPLEIWITEFGWTTCPASPPGVSEVVQADYILRSFLNYSKTDVNMVFLYNLRDGLLNEYHYYGILRNNFSQKSSFHVYKNFNRFFADTVIAPSGLASFTCAIPGKLETHVALKPSMDILISAWNSEDANDLLGIVVEDIRYGKPLLVNMVDGSETPAAGASRFPDGRMSVTGVTIGRTPAVLRFPRLSSPYIFRLEPERVCPGDSFTVNGFGFGQVQKTGAVYIGSVRVSEYLSWGENAIVARVPIGLAGRYPVKVVVEEGSSNEVPIEVFGVTCITPSQGVSGTVVHNARISGGGFVEGASVRLRMGSQVIVGKNVTVNSSTEITCTLDLSGALLGSYDVIVRNSDGKEAILTGGFRVTDACGRGAAASLYAFGLIASFLAVSGFSVRFRKG